MLRYHSNLLEAAERVGCKRFAPSEWDTGPLSEQKVDLLRVKLDIWEECQRSGLECARLTTGWFMNYLTRARESEGEEGRGRCWLGR